MRNVQSKAVFARFLGVILVMSLCISCERAPAPAPASSGGTSGDSVASSTNALKTFSEGGTISFTVQGQPYTAKIVDCYYNNTDEGYPDYVEIMGNGTLIHFSNEAKMEDDANGLSDFARIVGKALPLWTEMNETMEISLEGRGKYPIAGGSLTLERFEHGMEGRDWWEGRIELKLKTENGDTPVSGTYKTCIVPVW
ncbi:MAG: hypothetical protein K1Y02_25250 [Candidatus Hydrogenedentes bacterium]|nr:hypothetical protein [Candidatus Hydrogenedentota bacterium]